MVAAFAFVGTRIARQWGSVRSALEDANPALLALAVLVATTAMVAVAMPWRRALALMGSTVDRPSTVVWYFMGEIGKYLPGGVWPVIGRAELARRRGVPGPSAYGSVALSLGALYLAAMAVVVLAAPLTVIRASEGGALWVVCLLPLGIALLHDRPLGWLLHLAERMLQRRIQLSTPQWRQSVGLVARYVPAWFLIGTATWCVARSIDHDVSWLAVAPAAVLSWIVGFLTLPVPGGVGVREAVFAATATQMSSGVAATAAVIARVVFMLVDAGGAAVAAAVWRSRREAGRSEPDPPRLRS